MMKAAAFRKDHHTPQIPVLTSLVSTSNVTFTSDHSNHFNRVSTPKMMFSGQIIVSADFLNGYKAVLQNVCSFQCTPELMVLFTLPVKCNYACLLCMK